MKFLSLIAALGILASNVHQTHAQEWPAKPIRVVIPNAPGPVPDVMFRVMQPIVEQRLGAKFYLENIGGADGNIGTANVVRSAPDGYSLLLGPTGNYAVTPHMYKNLEYDPLRDLEPIATLWEAPLILTVPASLPVKTFRELESLIRSSPGKYNYGSPGSGSPAHLFNAQLSMATGDSMVYVPFKGPAPLATAMLAGDIHVACYSLAVVSGFLKAGKMRAIAVSSKQRLPDLPDVPTTAEAGYPQFAATNWWTLSAPRGTPPRIIERLAAEFLAPLNDAEVRRKTLEMGHLTVGLGPKESAAFIRSESARLKKIVDDGKITAQ